MNFLCFDTEDDSKELMQSGQSGFLKKVTQIAAITAEGKKFYNKGDTDQFKQWLKRQPERFIYAHNLQYDLGNLFKRIDEVDCTLVGGRLIKAVWGKKVFVDSFNIWPMSAKKLGEAFGLKKLETDNMATDKAYVFRDVEIIRQAMLFAWKFCDELGLSHLPPTLGGLCVKIWKAWAGENVHDSSVICHDAFYGGRVELFKPANETNDVCWTDINSLYPFVMQKEFPGILEQTGKKPLKHGVAKVTVQVPKTAIPVLPFRNELGRILYPFGKFTGTWTMVELREAQKQGANIVKIYDSMTTDESFKPYGTFVNKLYQARLASNSEAEKLFFKLLMNNLYGRLGTTGTIGRSVWQTEKNKYDGVPYGEKVLVEYQMPLSEETNWSHAAYVTAYGRLELFKYLQLVGAERMIYCDTDSVIFDCPGRSIPFPIGKELGQMKLESWESDCVPYAPKLYKAGEKYRAKGVPKHLAKQFYNTGRAEFDLPFKLREAIRFYDRKNSHRLSVWRKVEKIRRQTYDRKNLVGKRYFPCKIFKP